MRTPDNYDMYVAHEAAMYRYEASRLTCGWCGNPVQDEYGYSIEGETVCPKCMEQWLEDRREWHEESRHICAWCGNIIQDDHLYRVDGETVCPDCMEQWMGDRIVYVED